MNQFIILANVYGSPILLTDPTKVSVEFCVLKFSSFGCYHDGWRNNERQDPKLGMNKDPKLIFEGILKRLILGMPRKAFPLSSQSIGMPLGATFLFITWYEFSLGRRFLLFTFTSSLPQSSFAWHTYLREAYHHHNLLEYSMCFTYVFWA